MNEIMGIFRKADYFLSVVIGAVIVALVLCAPSGAAQAEEGAAAEAKPWGVNVSGGVYTDYIFRGKNVYEGTSFQPSVSGLYDFGDYGAASANVWMHVPGETNEPPEKFNELDFTLAYDLTFDPVTLSVGHIFYTFPGGQGRISDTNEYFVGVSLDVPLHPSLTFFNDYDEAKYQYYTLTLRQPLPMSCVSEDLTITPYATFGFATDATDSPRLYIDDGLEHIDVGASLDFHVGKLLMSPNFNFTFEQDDATDNEFWAGIDIGFDV